MFDFRYHALSLGAVFLALGLGIVLGATIGDSLVSGANRDLRGSLRQDVENARRDAREAQAGVNGRDQALAAAFPELVAGRLDGDRVAIVSAGSLPDRVETSAREAVEVGGGSVDSVAELSLPASVRELSGQLGGRFGAAATDSGVAQRLGRRIGRSIVSGSRSARRLQDKQPDTFRGDMRGATSVVIYRDPPDPDADPDLKKVNDAFTDGLVKALADGTATAVGVEQSSTDPSQVAFYADNDLSSVDDVESPAGRIALVFALGGSDGKFGLKGSAERVIPEP